MIIAIDGIDGTGKRTQSKMLEEYLLSNGYNVRLVSFPIYASFFGEMVSEYLNGNYGSLYSINPKLAALLYAQDRQLFFKHTQILDDEIIIFDRYVNSNIAHHSSKIIEKERSYLINWILELEYNVNRIPKPDISFVLDLEVENSVINVGNKDKRSYTESTYDLHEANTDYLIETRKIFISLVNGIDTHIIKCDVNKVIREKNDIAREISLHVDSLLQSKLRKL